MKGKIEQHLNVFVLVCCGEADSPASVTGLRTHCSHKKGDGRRGRKKKELLPQIVSEHCLVRKGKIYLCKEIFYPGPFVNTPFFPHSRQK